MPGQKAERSARELERLLREAAPAGADVSIEMDLSEPVAVRSKRPGDPAGRAGDGASLPASSPALIRLGGTLPLLSVLADRGITRREAASPCRTTAFHAPNESYRLESLRLGEAAARELYAALAELPRG